MTQEETPSKQSSCWDFFDAIYCINLENRTDRRYAAEQQFAAVGLQGRVEFFIVCKDQENPVRGIYTSHIYCLTKALREGARHILIFEDDVFFNGFEQNILRDACIALQKQAHWQAFFLGCITSGVSATQHNALVRINYRCLTHAYALNCDFAENVVNQAWQGTPYDIFLRRFGRDFFAIRPMCAYQGLISSDNGTIWIDRLRKLCGGLPLIQRGNELYQNHKPLVISLHLLAAAGIVLLCLLC